MKPGAYWKKYGSLVIHSYWFLSNFETLLGIKLLNIFIKVSVSILVFSLISLFWKAKVQLKMEIALGISSMFVFLYSCIFYNKWVVVVYRNSVSRIWYYDDIYRKLAILAVFIDFHQFFGFFDISLLQIN